MGKSNFEIPIEQGLAMIAHILVEGQHNQQFKVLVVNGDEFVSYTSPR